MVGIIYHKCIMINHAVIWTILIPLPTDIFTQSSVATSVLNYLSCTPNSMIPSFRKNIYYKQYMGNCMDANATFKTHHGCVVNLYIFLWISFFLWDYQVCKTLCYPCIVSVHLVQPVVAQCTLSCQYLLPHVMWCDIGETFTHTGIA